MALYIGIKNLIGKGAAWLRSKWSTIVTQLLATFRYRVAGGSDNSSLPESNGRAVFKKIYGNTVKWNQLAYYPDSVRTIQGVQCSISDNYITLTGTATAGGGRTNPLSNTNIPIITNHVYACIHSLQKGRIVITNSQAGHYSELIDFTTFRVNRATRDFNGFVGINVVQDWTYNESGYINIFDLTDIFGAGSEPTTVDEVEAWLALNVGTQDYYPYDEGSLVSFKGQGVKVTGWNKFHVVNGSGVADVKKDVKYYVAGPFGSLHYSDGTAISVASDRTFTAIKDDTITFGSVSNSIVLNIYTGTAKDGTYEPYHEEIVDLSGAYINVWDEVWEEGGINSSGQLIPSTTYFRAKNYIRVLPSTVYNITNLGINRGSLVNYYGYNEEKNFISFRGTIKSINDTIETPANCHYILIRSSGNTPDSTYQHDICINVSNADINGTYYPHALQSAGSVADEDTETELTKKLMAVDMGNLVWQYRGAQAANVISTNSITNYAHKGGKLSVCYPYSAYNSVTNINQMPNAPDKCHTFFATSPSNSLFIKDSDIAEADIDAQGHCQKLEGVILIYELATPVVVPHDTPMQYAVNKYSTEELLVPASVAGEPTSTALVADIEYQAK